MNFTPDKVRGIVSTLVGRSLFDDTLFYSGNVLTSAGIQRRYVRAAAERRNIEIINEYFLLDVENEKDVPKGVIDKLTFISKKLSNNGVNPPKNKVNQSINPQSKVKESRVKESRESMSGAEAPDRQAVISLLLNDKSLYPIYQDQIKQWEELYPAVDVMQQLRSMAGWLKANPSRRKTKNGIERFINGWLSKEQDRGKAPTRNNISNMGERNYSEEQLEAMIKDPIAEYQKKKRGAL